MKTLSLVALLLVLCAAPAARAASPRTHTAASSTTATSAPALALASGNAGALNPYTLNDSFSPDETHLLIGLAMALGAAGLVLTQRRSMRAIVTRVWG